MSGLGDVCRWVGRGGGGWCMIVKGDLTKPHKEMHPDFPQNKKGTPMFVLFSNKYDIHAEIYFMDQIY